MKFDANITHSFYYASTEFAGEAGFVAAVRHACPSAVFYEVDRAYDDPCIGQMQTAERFLHGGGQACKVSRFFVYEQTPQDAVTDWRMMLSFFPEVDVLAISFHYGLSDVSADHLIVLRQCGENRPFTFPDGPNTCIGIAYRLAKQLGLKAEADKCSFLCEITRFGAYEEIGRIEQDHAPLLYSFLTGDEGHRFVPETLARKRLCYQWGSRRFIRIYAFGQAFLFLNLLHTPDRADYLTHQAAFSTAAYGGCDPYFMMGSCPLTVNHGILFSVEYTMMLKTLIDSVALYQTDNNKKRRGSFYRHISATRSMRRKIIVVLERVERTEISEIGELSTVLLESQHIAPIVDKVKYLLELLEGDLSLLYSERNNMLVTFLTVLGLILAAWQIVLALI
ncbi:MAG: hypothetical protein IJP30_03875 [Clostridia bacterium]|nr:hypothetical protein [Clostridia bacterium]